MRKIIAASTLFVCLNICSAQSDPVVWRLHVETSNIHEARLVMEASLAPGWHLYSHYLKDGGPVPTTITFEKSSDYTLIGRVEESGEPFKFYDEMFEMDIIWYAQRATFSQGIRLYRPIATINGEIEYMTCNDAVCIPARHAFSINIDPSKHKK